MAAADSGFPPPEAIAAAAPEPPAPAPGPESIRAWTRAIQRGDAEMFSRFYDAYSFRLYQYLLVLARGNETEAQEACQAALIKVAKRFQAFETEAALWAWLRTVGRNAFVDQYRARRRHDRLLIDHVLDPDTPAAAHPESQLAELLTEALRGLPPEERELLLAAYVDQRPLHELAEETRQTYKALEGRLARLRRKIKEHLLKALRHE